MFDKINKEHVEKLRALLFLPVNEPVYAGDSRDSYMFDDITHVYVVDGGIITANITGDVVNSIGTWSDNSDSRRLVKGCIDILRYSTNKYEVVNFGCYVRNKRLCSVMSKRFGFKVINQTDSAIYYKYEGGVNAN